MCDVPSIAVFCSESIECFPGTASKFVFKLLLLFQWLQLLLVYYYYYYYYYIVTCKRDLVLYKALLIVYNTFRAQPEDGCIRGAETCCCYK